MFTLQFPSSARRRKTRRPNRLSLEILENRDVPSFVDGFEGPTLDPFWTTTQQSGFVTMPSTQLVHSGSQALQLNTTMSSANKEVIVSHSFDTPVIGRFSVWMYDTGADVVSSNFMGLFLYGPTSSNLHGIYLPDYDLGPGRDGSTYVWQANNIAIRSSIDRTPAWHQFTFESNPEGTTFMIDGNTVGTNPEAIPITWVGLALSGPSWRPAFTTFYDDFEFQEYNPNQPPVLNPIGNKSVDEGSTLSFAAIATDPNAGDSLTYSLDSGAPAGATIDPATGQFSYFPADGPGTAQVTVRVSDSGNPALSDTETFAISVNNLAPTATGITGPSVVAVNENVNLILTATDPSTVDQAVGFDWKLDWNNDGAVDETVSGASGMSVSHQFAAGMHTVSAVAVDKDGGVGPEATHTIRVGQVFVVDGNLHVYGTAANDDIRILRQGAGLRVKINGKVIGTFNATGKIKAFGGGGDDRIWSNALLPREFYGEDGNDTLVGGSAKDLLDGGTGYLDRLFGAGGDDNLNDADGVAKAAGGAGADKLAISFASDWNNNGNLKLPAGAMTGGAGDDQIKITANNAALEFALSGNAGDDLFELNGKWGQVRVLGMGGTDTLKNLGIGIVDVTGIEVQE